MIISKVDLVVLPDQMTKNFKKIKVAKIGLDISPSRPLGINLPGFGIFPSLWFRPVLTISGKNGLAMAVWAFLFPFAIGRVKDAKSPKPTSHVTSELWA